MTPWAYFVMGFVAGGMFTVAMGWLVCSILGESPMRIRRSLAYPRESEQYK